MLEKRNSFPRNIEFKIKLLLEVYVEHFGSFQDVSFNDKFPTWVIENAVVY